jgi:hypothetical protein
MVFDLAWTVGDASSVSYQFLNKFIFFVACLVASLHCHSWNTLNIRCGTTENMTMDLPHCPHNLDFFHLPFVPHRSGASFSCCVGVILEPEWNLELQTTFWE